MTLTQPEHIMAAADHLVSVDIITQDGGGTTFAEHLTGVLKAPHDDGGGDIIFDVFTAFVPGSYSSFDPEPLGATEGMRMRLSEVVGFTDHGERSDALLTISQQVATREHALQALRDIEANLERSFKDLTNLTAQEG